MAVMTATHSSRVLLDPPAWPQGPGLSLVSGSVTVLLGLRYAIAASALFLRCSAG
jgi:hypothetical protein